MTTAVTHRGFALVERMLLVGVCLAATLMLAMVLVSHHPSPTPTAAQDAASGAGDLSRASALP